MVWATSRSTSRNGSRGDPTGNPTAVIADFTAATFGPASILVNNAAANRGDDRQAVTDLPLGAWHTVMNTNNDSVFLVSRAFARQMLAAGKGGSIVNISSIAGKVFGANTAAYASSKAAIQAITKVMCRELGPHNIRVNCICPGLTDTPQFQYNLQHEKIGKIIRSVEKWIPLKRFGKPDEIAQVAIFLASDASSAVTGAIIADLIVRGRTDRDISGLQAARLMKPEALPAGAATQK